MRVVVYDPTPTGHHFAYIALMVPPLAELATELFLLTTDSATRAPQFALHLGKVANQFQVDTGVAESSNSLSIGSGFGRFRSLCRAVERLKPDRLYVPYGDPVVAAAGLDQFLGGWSRRSIESEVLLLRGGYQYPANRWRQTLSRRVLPKLVGVGPWDRVHYLNSDDLEVLKRQSGETAARFCLMPDPVEPPSKLSRIEARRKMKLPEEGRYIGCAGGIDSRKGIDLLVHAFRRAHDALAPSDRLLLAGPIEPAIRQLIERELDKELRDQRVMLVDRHLSVDEVNEAVAALDAVCTPYPRHPHSASIVIRAAAHERYVLGNAIGWMQSTIARFGLGTTCNVRDGESFSRAIINSLDESARFVPTEASRRFAAFHSSHNFGVHWAAGLRTQLGLPADPTAVSWDWVLAALP